MRRQHRELFGTDWTAIRDGEARLSCPGCGVDGEAARTRLQRYITVLERRVARLGGPEAFVTCGNCGRAYRLADLDADDDRPRLSADEAALAGLVAAVVFSDSVVRRAEKQVARQVIAEYTGRTLSSAEFDEVLHRARRRWGDPVARLEKLAELVPAETRHRIVVGAYRVCAADGELHREESRLLDRVGDALNLSPRDVRVVLRQAKAGRPAR